MFRVLVFRRSGIPAFHVLVQAHDDSQDEQEYRAMEWKKFRPSKIRTLWYSMYFGFFISILAATLIGTFSILVYYVAYQVTLVCLARPKDSIPSKIQWSKTISECMEIIFLHLWFFVNTPFFFRSYQIMGLKSKLFLVSSVFLRFRCCLSHCSSGARHFSIRVNAFAKNPWKYFIFV